ncbi:M15 family metallopeptidase [Paenibacillus bouchesdurhonensis]|uniref:M15 family metallopeptidase n=1 Tax=Paenibacillus bouchesdurhonensis TaxID=1870990 RepID=UPI000DA61C42|nr:M15 family metallopeptidase [Paenibacillus bouchesdurhonensis]
MSRKWLTIGLGLAALLAVLLAGCSSTLKLVDEQNLSIEATSEETGAGEHAEEQAFSGGAGSLETEQGSEQEEKEAESDLVGDQAEIGQISEQEGEEAESEAEAGQAGDHPAVEIAKARKLPEGFVYVDEVLKHAFYEIRYYGEYNFVGQPIDGYHAPFAILSEQAANALKKAEQALEPLGYALLIYDAYRPQKAVEHFGQWAADERDVKMKEEFYPDIDKKNVFKLGYLSHRSGHSRGSTVDLTLADQETGEPLDMGGIHDFLGEISAHDAAGLTEAQAENRLLLKETMMAAGFKPYRKEWWHYTLNNEPYPKKYFDFDVE